MVDKNQIISALGMVGIRQYYEGSTGCELGGTNTAGETDHICCPFHSEKTGSFAINLSSGLWHCYGACDKGGSIFDFHIQKNGGNFNDSMKYFCNLAGLPWAGNGDGGGKNKTLDEKFSGKWTAARSNTLVKAMPYFKSRGIIPATVGLISEVLAGYTSKAYAGSYKGKGVYAPAIVVPMWEFTDFGPDRKLVGIQNIFPDPPITQKKTSKEERLGKRHEKGSKPDWGGSWFGNPESDIWVITEAFIDGLSVFQACPDVFVIVLFAAGYTKALKNRIPEGKKIVCFFDIDKTGDKATREMARMYPDAKTVKWDIGIYDDGADVNDVLKTDGKEEIQMMVNEAVRVDLAALAKSMANSLIVADISECESLPDAVEAINTKYCMIKLGGAVRIMEEFIDPVFGRPDLEFMSVPDFKTLLGNIDIDGITAVNFWLKSQERRQYERMVFAPGQDVGPNIYNLWKGFDIEPLPPPSKDDTGCDLFLSLTYEVIADQNEYLYQWVLAWLADMVKNPGGKRPETSLALQGDMGTGKSFFVEYFGGIFGQHFLTVDSAERLVDKFNFILKDAIPVHCDEGFFAGNKQMAAILKHLVTGDVNVIEPKNVNAIKVRNFVRLFFSTNSDWVVPAGFNERRFAVLKVSNAFRQDKKFFGEAAEERDSGGRGHLLHYLLNFKPDPSLEIDITKIPKTEALFNQIIASAETIEKFWFELLSDGWQDVFGGWTVNDILYDRYLLFAEKIDGQKYKATKSKFTREIKRLCPSMVSCTQTIQGIVLRGYRLESLEICRVEFQSQMCVKITWPTE